jgi:hypothetical protein
MDISYYSLREYIDRSRGTICISGDDRLFIKTRLMPPETWTIVACSLDAKEWFAKYRRHSHLIVTSTDVLEYYSAVLTKPTNTQISSFGMGRLFVQVFSCPNDILNTDFRIAARARGLVQLWPIPTRFWPLPQRPAKFPTKLVLDKNGADAIADEFHQRLEIMTHPINGVR